MKMNNNHYERLQVPKTTSKESEWRFQVATSVQCAQIYKSSFHKTIKSNSIK